MSDVLVSVRMSGDAYIARAGNGKASKTAASTSCGPFAVKAAASKFLNVAEDRITIIKHSPGVFRASVVVPE